MATESAIAPTAYDPIKPLEGMFNGSITRIAQALQDPVNYGPPTKTVLTEVAKRFHDALDDCEIQLLDAKWYLEFQLAQNRLKREAKASEGGSALKRKHDVLLDLEAQAETPSKKAKIGDPPQAEALEASEPSPSADAKVLPKVEGDIEKKSDVKEDTVRVEEDQAAPQEDFLKAATQDTPIEASDLNFESMFGEPTTNGEDDALEFDLDLENAYNSLNSPAKKEIEDVNTNTQGEEVFNGLLPGLDDFTNQAAENPITTSATSDALPAFSNDFGLPEIGGSPNEFDDLFGHDSLEGTNFDGNIDLSDKALMDMDFDESMFN